MKFSTKEDLEVPIEAVFEMMCDFDTFERSAMRRGVDVLRMDQLQAPGVGMKWQAEFQMRGKKRQVEIEMVVFEPSTEMVLEGTSKGLSSTTTIELIALSRSRTRVGVELDLQPLNLSARLLVQSLKLAKNSLTQKYKQRVSEYAAGMEKRYASTA